MKVYLDFIFMIGANSVRTSLALVRVGQEKNNPALKCYGQLVYFVQISI